jgi:hypothetical protein
MSTVSDLCDRIMNCHRALGSKYPKYLKHGLSRKEIEKATAECPFVLPDSLVELYMWRNGTELAEGLCFYPLWFFDSLEESVARFTTFSETGSDGFWKTNWFPFLFASDVSSIGIVCGRVRKMDAKVVMSNYGLGSGPEFASLEVMHRTVLGWFENGAFFMGKDGILELKEDLYTSIGKKMNPEMKGSYYL